MIMNGPCSYPPRLRAWPAVVVAIAVLSLVVTAYASIRLSVPDEDPGGPYYARIEFGAVYHTQEWAAIAFYRNPGCVPAQFNLLRFFDFNFPRVLGCPLTVDGFEVWKNGPPPVDMAPIHAKLRGLGAVPVWFVAWPELQAAIADGSLSKSELLTLSSLRMGTATYFRETIHPDGGSQQNMLEIVAQGTLPDGSAFSYMVTEAAGELQRVQIEFK